MGSIDLFQTWRSANHAAVIAANVVLVKSLLALDGKGPLPTAVELEEVRTLRCVADDLFELTVARSDEVVAARQLRGDPESEFVSTWAVPIAL
jgi:hypothetical protein